MDKKKQKSETSVSKKKSGKEESTKYAKRPMSAFFIFSQSLREDIKKNGGSISGVEGVAKMAGKKWGEMSDLQKKPFMEKAAADKERYENEISSGMTAPPRKYKSSKNQRGVKKDPNRPKRATSAYLYYMSDFRKTPEASALKHTEIMKAVADKWKTLSVEEKKKYVELEKKDKLRYQKEMESYNPPPKSKETSKKGGKPKGKGKASKNTEVEPSPSESESEEVSDVDDESTED